MKTHKNYFLYWGKCHRDSKEWHPLVYHNLDVAAVATLFLEHESRLRSTLLSVSGLPEKILLPTIQILAAIHDIGKFSERFQALNYPLFTKLTEGTDKSCNKSYIVRHDTLGFILWEEYLAKGIFNDKTFPIQCDYFEDSSDLIKPLICAVMGHHGIPPEITQYSYKKFFSSQTLRDVKNYVNDVLKLFFPDSSQSFIVSSKIDEIIDNYIASLSHISWLIAGIFVISDWLGSDDKFFSFINREMSLDKYWEEIALIRGKRVLEQSGILGKKKSNAQSFSDFFPKIEKPTPLQQYLDSVEPTGGGNLFIIEDATGSGKTEAALHLAHRLLSSGKGEGIFIALPTMATANAMFERVGDVYQKLFSKNANPSMVLAHSKRKMSNIFNSLWSSKDLFDDDNENKISNKLAPYCSRWLGDNRKKALLAQVGVGTIDQALISILPIKHQSLRLLGISQKILIVDEVHACDNFMIELLLQLLRFHFAYGGSAILLSATLPSMMRRRFEKIYLNKPNSEQEQGRSKKNENAKKNESEEFDEYPLLTAVIDGKVENIGLEPCEFTSRTCNIKFIHEIEGAFDILVQSANSGACSCWICNTVKDAQSRYKQLIEMDVLNSENIILFHSRFTMIDRLEIEKKIIDFIGSKSSFSDRKSKIVIATQVIEQSLDIDFDIMISDLAPIDLIIQRLGRLHRHQRNYRPKEYQEPNLYILSPIIDNHPKTEWYSDMFPGGAAIYPDHGRLWLTAKLLKSHGKIVIPNDLRFFIESVYSERAEKSIPAAFEKQLEKVIGENFATKSLSMQNKLKFDTGYCPTTAQWEKDIYTPTRLGEKSTIVRLGILHNEEIIPIAGTEILFPWRFSELTLPITKVYSPIDSEDAEFEGKRQKALENMADGGEWSILLIMEKQHNGDLICRAKNIYGKKLNFHYNKKLGFFQVSQQKDGL